MTTIRDVARLAGVSVGTVSNVLNSSTLVRTETRERVLAAIDSLNYHPTVAARSLNTQLTYTIGMVRTELRPSALQSESDPFILDLIDGVSTAAIGTGIGLAFWTIPVGSQEIDLYERLVLGRQIDGLILFAVRDNDPRIEFLKKQNFPFVVFGRYERDDTIHWIDVDGAYGIELAVKHLADLGHERIAYLSPPREQHLAHLRWQGFEKEMGEVGLKIDPALILEGDFTEHSGELGMHSLLNDSHPPTAIICNNDRMAFGAMRAVQARGLKVGRDVSVVGFDDIPLSCYWHPPLTTVSQPTREIGEMLFGLLQAVIAGEVSDAETRQLIKPELHVRSSTGKPV